MSSPRKTLLLLFVAAAATGALSIPPSLPPAAAPPSSSGKKLVVHEWGTFTSLQDETGRNLAGINSDDEPVPPFVHRLAPNVGLAPTDRNAMRLAKGLPIRLPNVTMRLETPVLYFYPPADRPEMHVDVRVQFRGGWLSEFYPQAEYKAPGFKLTAPVAGRISPDESGELLWRNLHLGAKVPLVETNAPVWLAPRAVQAATVTGGPKGDETEKYVFYRGVGNVQPPVRVTCDATRQALLITDGRPDAYRHGWLVSIRSDGALAFLDAPAGQPLPAEFPGAAYAPENMAKLRRSMETSLVRNGLYPDEAAAMLETWQAAYFKSPGLRFFYLCPRAETDALLPLELSEPAALTRVMIGRIELVTPEQRTLLRQLRRAIEPVQLTQIPAPSALVWCGGPPPEPTRAVSLKRPAVPPEYEKLGRFRNALLLDEQARQPSEALQSLLTTLGL